MSYWPLLTAIAVVTVGLLGAGGWWLHGRYIVVTVDGESMSPTYPAGCRVLVRHARPETVRAGQVLVFAGFPAVRDDGSPSWVIKRVRAAPGDPVPREAVPVLRAVPETRVPPGRLVVLGDRSDRSYDSRRYGYLAADRVMGVVVRTLPG